MGIEKFRRPLLVTGVPVPQGGSGAEDASVDPTASTVAMRGSDGSLRAVAGQEDDSVVNELRLNQEMNNITDYVNSLDEEVHGLITALTARVTALEAE